MMMYLRFYAQSPALHDHGHFGKLIKQILPLTRQLPKCALSHEEYPPERRKSDTSWKDSIK